MQLIIRYCTMGKIQDLQFHEFHHVADHKILLEQLRGHCRSKRWRIAVKREAKQLNNEIRRTICTKCLSKIKQDWNRSTSKSNRLRMENS